MRDKLHQFVVGVSARMLLKFLPGKVESVVAPPEPGQQIALQLFQVVARRELVRGPMAKIEAAFNPCQRLIRLAV